MHEPSLKDEEHPLPVLRRFVRSEVFHLHSATETNSNDNLALTEPDSAGYNPYDHVPVVPVQSDEVEEAMASSCRPGRRAI